MKQIPTLFEREYKDHKVVGITDKLTSPGLQVVLDGKCTPTVKYDGSCLLTNSILLTFDKSFH